MSNLYLRTLLGGAASLLVPLDAEARRGGTCHGDCGGVVGFLAVAVPLILIYLKFWNTRKGGPSFGQALAYATVSIGLAFILVGLLHAGLKAPLWLAWVVGATAGFASFGYLVHPSRFPSRR